jgi:hypothetical protein
MRRHTLLPAIVGAIGLGAVTALIERARRRRPFAPDETGVDSTQRTPMAHNIAVNVGDHVFFEDGGEEIGAVRKVEKDHLVVYVEGAGDFVIRGPEVKAVHYNKVILSPELVDPRLLEAARTAHENETE